MALESVTHISDLNASNPASGDAKSQGDDHIRNIKTALKTDFPNISGPVTASHTDLSKVGVTQALSSNDTSPASTAFVKAVLNTAPAGSLPALSSNALKFLRVNSGETAVEWAGVAKGGAAASGSVVLTSSSSGAQSITTTAYNQSITFPDATTLQKDALNYAIYNAGQYPLRILDAAGTTLGWVPPYQTVTAGLADNATAAGVWVLAGHDLMAVTGVVKSSTVTTSTALLGASWYNYLPQQVITMSPTKRAIFNWAGASIYCTIHDTISGFGTPTLVATVISNNASSFAALEIDASRILILYGNNTTQTQLNAMVLSVSGTTVTTNSAVTTTLAGNLSQINGVALISGAYVVGYSRGTNVAALRAFTVSGTTPSAMSAETVITSAEVCRGLYVQGTQGITLGYKGAATATTYAYPFTVSGTTITLGTVATSTTLLLSSAPFNIPLSGGLITLDCSSTVHGYITATGNVATISTFNANINTSVTNRRFQHYVVSNTKVIINNDGAIGIISISGTSATISSLAGTARAFVYCSASRVVTASETSVSGGTSIARAVLCETYDVSGSTPVQVGSARFDFASGTAGNVPTDVHISAGRGQPHSNIAAAVANTGPRPANWFNSGKIGAGVGGAFLIASDGYSVWKIPTYKSLDFKFSLTYLAGSEPPSTIAGWPSGVGVSDTLAYLAGENDSIYCVECAA